MNNEVLKKLCLDMAKKENGDDVAQILKDHGVWDDDSCWRTVGGHDGVNVYSIIGAQQSDSAIALREFFVNPGDSVLTMKCLEMEIDPTNQEETPDDVKSAIEKYLDVAEGRWINASTEVRRSVAEEYCNFVATGESGTGSNPTYAIIDKCEGQHPNDFQNTFLSLTGKNKQKIKFVQGQYGMGSYGVLNFCRQEVNQLIISKKNPKVSKNLDSNDSWGFTVIRKFSPMNDERNSTWKYLIIDDNIPNFEENDLKLLPGKYPDPYGGEFKYGTFRKLYNYEIGTALRSNINLDLNYKMSALLVNPVVPVRFYERRKYSSQPHTLESTLDGLETKIERDRSGVIANGFPCGFTFNVENQKFVGNIYAFNKENKKGHRVDVGKNYANGIIFTYHGQTQGSLPRTFFRKNPLKYDNISSNLLVVIDCSQMDSKHRESLFQTNRERIYDNDFTKKIKKQISNELAGNQAIKTFQNEWRSKSVKETLENKKTTALFEELISNDPTMKQLFGIGGKIKNPFGQEEHISEFKSEEFPTFFKLKKLHPKENPREVEIGRDIRISLETNAPNDYITRPKDPGSFKVFREEDDISNLDGVRLSGVDGNWFLALPESKKELEKYCLEITDVFRYESMKIPFNTKLIEKREHKNGKYDKKPRSSQLTMPPIIELRNTDFEEHDIDEKDMLFIEDSQDNPLPDFFINMDNIYVNGYLKRLKDTEIEMAKEQYKIVLSLLGLLLYQDHKEFKSKEESSEGIKDYTKTYTRTIAPILMKCIREIAKLGDD